MHDPTFKFTAKEVNILVQAIELALETGALTLYGKVSEIDRIKEKLNKGGVK